MEAHKVNEVRKVVGQKNASVTSKTDEQGQYFTVTAFDETGRNRVNANLRDSETFHAEDFWTEASGGQYKNTIRAYGVTVDSQ